jgi:transcription factor SPT20
MTVRHSTRVYCGARLIYHFYPGCMIVELLDYRPQRNKEPTLEKPERTRAVLHPNAETLWADICSLNQKYGGNWSDEEALELEARLLVSIHPKSRH